MSIKVTSPAFEDGGPIPIKYIKDGQNVSPPIRWESLPEGTRELALIVEDPDAPKPEPFVHWVVYKIRPDAGELPEGVPQQPKPSIGAVGAQGVNDFKDVGYDGPQPPQGHGTHHYHFRIYALDKPLEVGGQLDHKSLIASMSGHILDTGEIVGIYENPA